MPHCPICGRWEGQGHKCPPRVLRAIDAANTRAANEEFESWSREPFHRTEAVRLREGLRMMFQED